MFVSISSYLPAPAPGSEQHVRHLELRTSESPPGMEIACTFFWGAEGAELAHLFVLVPCPEKTLGGKGSQLVPLCAGPWWETGAFAQGKLCPHLPWSVALFKLTSQQTSCAQSGGLCIFAVTSVIT